MSFPKPCTPTTTKPNTTSKRLRSLSPEPEEPSRKRSACQSPKIKQEFEDLRELALKFLNSRQKNQSHPFTTACPKVPSPKRSASPTPEDTTDQKRFCSSSAISKPVARRQSQQSQKPVQATPTVTPNHLSSRVAMAMDAIKSTLTQAKTAENTLRDADLKYKKALVREREIRMRLKAELDAAKAETEKAREQLVQAKKMKENMEQGSMDTLRMLLFRNLKTSKATNSITSASKATASNVADFDIPDLPFADLNISH